MEYLNYPKQKEYTEKSLKRIGKWLFFLCLSLFVTAILLFIFISILFFITRKNG